MNSNHQKGCTCAGCAVPTNQFPHWKERRQQRLNLIANNSGAHPPACKCLSCHEQQEYEYNDDDPPHNYWRRRRELRHGWRFSDLDTEDETQDGSFKKLVQSILYGQRRAAADLASLRRQLNLPAAGTETKKKYTLSKLTIGDKSYYGVNAHGTKVFLAVNPISRTHAEGDVFNQARKDTLTSTTGILFVDRTMCVPCGVKGAVTSMARQIGLKKLVIIEPGATTVFNL